MIRCEEGRVEITGEEGVVCAEALTLVKNLRKYLSEEALKFFDTGLTVLIKPKAVKEDEKIFRLVMRGEE